MAVTADSVSEPSASISFSSWPSRWNSSSVRNRSRFFSYIIELEDRMTIYHAGDTGVFGDMAWIGSYDEPDVALLPIGGHFTMDPAHAAYAVRELLAVKTVVPIHYGTFPPLKGTPEQFKAALGDYPADVVVMQPGEVRDF